MIGLTTHPISVAGGTSPSRVCISGNKQARDQVEGLDDEGRFEGRKKPEVKGRSQSTKGGRKTTSKVSGKGSRTGKNACPPGASDEEISHLVPSDIADARVTKVKASWGENEKEKLVSYIVDVERWPNFKINQAKIFLYVSCAVKYL